MKPARFSYHRPTTLDEAVSLLTQYDGEAKPLSGGQSLIPLMNMRLARPSALIDLSRIDHLSGIRSQERHVVFGAMTRHRSVETSPLVRQTIPILSEAVRYIGHAAIRTRGTIGGSIAHADPAAELPAIAALLDGEFTLTGPDGERKIGWEPFFQGYLMTALEPSEILTGVTLPAPQANAGWSFIEMARRHGDFAIAGVGVIAVPDDGGRLADVRVALFGVAPSPVRARSVEAALRGAEPNRKLFTQVAELIRDEVSPDGDVHGSSEYRTQLACVLTQRALTEAAGRAFPAAARELVVR
jgi:carbon-monoxide dehydrogenase medium subunit